MAGVGCASLMLCTCAIDHRLGSLLLTSPPLTHTFDTLRTRVGLGVGGVMLWFDLLRSRWGNKDQRGVF